MAISAGKVAPSVVVLALVGYCAWPSVSELMSDPPPPKQPVKVPELAAALLSPTLPARPTKNPWGGLDVASLAAAKEAAKEAAKKDAAKEAAAKEAAKEAAKMDAAKAADKTAGAPAGSATAKKPVDPLDSLKLEATCTLGNQRLAMINGQLYAPQDRLSTANSSLPPFRIVSVFPNKVLLECKGKTVELTYDGVVSRAAPSPKVESPKVELLDKPTAVMQFIDGLLLKKLSSAATALQSGATKKSDKAGD
jgi:hypothetical protein